MHTHLCTWLTLAARWVWNNRKLAIHCGLPFSEETITEILLLALGDGYADQVFVQPFTKKKESKIGADWEWCFFNASRKKFFRMRVQAKLLSGDEKKYMHLDKKIGTKGGAKKISQIDKLIDEANKQGIPAVYIFYNYVSNIVRIPHSNTPPEHWGCSIALADVVRSKLPDKSFDTISKISDPWHVIACPSATKPGADRSMIEVQDQAAEAIRGLYRRDDGPDPTTSRYPRDFDKWGRSQPSYFGSVMEIAAERQGDRRTDLIAQLAAENPSLDGVVLVGDRRLKDGKGA